MCGVAVARASSSLIVGTFALQGSVPRTAGHLSVTQVRGNPLDLKFDIWMTNSRSAAPIRSYDVDLTKYLHLIVVNDNFTMFLHIHPVLQSNGHFIMEQHLPFPGVFHLYADGEPHGLGQQVFRFDLTIGHPKIEGTTTAGTTTRDLSERHMVANVGGYTVQLSSNELTAGNEAMIAVHILKNGVPAGDLHPYLGALAHAVFLSASDLSYIHVHPVPFSSDDMNDGTMPPENTKPLPANSRISPNMMLHVALNEPGIYKLWLQFQGGKRLIIAPFVITAVRSQ